MSFIECDDLVRELAATTSHPALRGSILPRRSDAPALRFQTGRLQKRDHGGSEFRIAVQDHITVWTSVWKSISQLLHDPLRTRMSSRAAVEDPAVPLLDDQEAVQQLERQRRHGEEIPRDDRLPVILKECKPSLGCVAAVVVASRYCATVRSETTKPSFCNSPWI
jgi:hypothetical protein